MAAKTLREVIEIAICVGPVSEFRERFTGELRDFLAHEVARHCKRHNDMARYDVITEFVQELLSEIPACKGGKK